MANGSATAVPSITSAPASDIVQSPETSGEDQICPDLMPSTNADFTDKDQRAEAHSHINGICRVEEQGNVLITPPPVVTLSHPSPPPDDKLPRPSFKEEKLLQSYVAKAHAQVREGTAVASTSEDKEKALVRYAEMVSHMIHLLGLRGIGRNTTVRALAYLAGENKPSAGTALRQAIEDRREVNNRMRKFSNTSRTSQREDAQQASDQKSLADIAAVPGNAANVKTVGDDVGALRRVDQTQTSADTTLRKTTDRDQLGATSATADAKSENLSTKNGAKKGGRRKWWGGSGRRHTTGNKDRMSKHKDTAPAPAANAKEVPEVELGAALGTPDIASSTVVAKAVPVA